MTEAPHGETIQGLPLFPLNTVLFPSMVLPLHIFEDRYRRMISECLDGDGVFGVALIKSGREVGGPAEPYAVGATARIVHCDQLDDGRMNLLILGEDRFRIQSVVEREPFMIADVELIPRLPLEDDDLSATTEEVAGLFEAYVRTVLDVADKDDGGVEIDVPLEPEELADFAAARLQIETAEKQRLLEMNRVEDVLEAERELLDREQKRLSTLLAVKRIQRKSPGELRKGFFSPN